MVAEKKVGWLVALILLGWTTILVTVLSCYVNAKDPPPKEVKGKAVAKTASAVQQPPQKAPDPMDPILTRDPILGSPVPIQKTLQGQSMNPTMTEELKKVGPNWESWRVVVFFYCLSFLVFLLVLFLRYKPLDEWLGKHELKALKPHLAVVLGVVLNFSIAWLKSEQWLPSFILGLLGGSTGLSAVGLHQLLTKGNKK
jgi:hypothetical protein